MTEVPVAMPYVSSPEHSLRIGLILNTFPEISETFLIHHIAAMLEGGHDVTIFAERAAAKPVHEAVAAHGMLGRTRFLSNQGRGAQQLIRVPRAFVAGLGTRGVLRCLNVARYGTGILRFRALLALRDVAKESFDLLHCHYASIGWAYLAYRDIFRVPFVTSFHGDHYKSFRTKGRTHLRNLFQQGDAFIANGRFTAGELRKLGCPEEKIHVIPAVVCDEGAEFRPRTGGTLGPTGRIRILCVARLCVSKGIIVAMHALRRLREQGHQATLTLAGDGTERDYIARECRRIGVTDAVTFAGWLTQREVFACYREADVLILPSIGDASGANESQGVVLQEAMLHGVPVIASELGGVPESVDQGAAGLLFRAGDVGALTDLIIETASNTDATLKRVHHAVQYVRNKYLKPAVLRGHEHVYMEALRRYYCEPKEPVPRLG